MRRFSVKQPRLLATAVIGMICFVQSSLSSAQTTLEEVVVTATRRETSLQDTGLSITAFSGEQLREANAVRFDDIAVQTPGLRYTQAGGAPLLALISIRGVAQNDFAHHLEAANVLYIDDVYRPSTGSNIQNLFDINRVEVLKGPQGTLFGRNATGGLIHILTQDPTDQLEGYVDLTYAEYNDLIAEGAVNIPLSETAAARVAVSHRQHDGWIENSIGPDSIADDTTAARAKLLFEPNEGWRVKLQGEWYRTDNVDAGGGFPTGGFVGPDTLGQFRPSLNTDTGYIDADGDVFTGEFDFPGKYDREEYVVFADIEYQTGNYTFKSISAYSDLDVSYSEDNDLTPFDITLFRQSTDQQNFTQELRLNADFERWRLTGGAYYLDISGDYFQNFQIDNLGNFDQILAPIPILILPVGFNQFANYELDTESWSIFTQGEYDLTPQLTLTFGARYTEDKKDYVYLNSCENSLPMMPACPPAFDPATLAGAGLVTDSHSEDGISARLQADYALTDDVLLFASYNRGYKAFNYNAGFAGAAPVADMRFDGEFLNAYEIGTKLDFWERRARLNVSAFYYDYNDYQALDQRGVQFILSNTDATIYGAEAEFTVNPGYGINLQLGLALLNTDVQDIPIAGQLLDREAPQSPDLTFNFFVSKDFQLNAGTVRLSFDGAYTDEYFSQLTNAPVTLVDSNWLLNARLSFTSKDERWEAAIFVRNLLDEERQVYAFDITFPGNGLVEQTYAPPRWVGGHIRYNF
jgi:iron complex outermembrane receptor protein